MHSLRLPELAALFALRDGPALLLDLKERAFRMLAAGRTVTLDARLAAPRIGMSSKGG